MKALVKVKNKFPQYLYLYLVLFSNRTNLNSLNFAYSSTYRQITIWPYDFKKS